MSERGLALFSFTTLAKNCAPSSALLRRRVGAEGLLDRVDVVVDRLREAHHDQLVVVLREVGREVRRRRVRVVAADRVQHVHAVLHELVGRHLERVLAFLHEAALHAVLHVRELHAAVADRAAAVLREEERVLADFRRHGNRLALQEAHVAVDVADHLHVRRRLRVGVDQEPDRGTEARREAAGRQERNFLNCHFTFLLCFCVFLKSASGRSRARSPPASPRSPCCPASCRNARPPARGSRRSPRRPPPARPSRARSP